MLEMDMGHFANPNSSVALAKSRYLGLSIPVVLGIIIQPTFALARVVRGTSQLGYKLSWDNHGI